MMISKRLDTIINTIRPCKTLADVGCDHGIVSIRAVQKHKAQHVIAADVAKGPLEAAKRNVSAEGTLHSTEFVLSNGLMQIPDNLDLECIVIAGMGGMLIKDILENAGLTRFPNLKQLVLGPQSDMDTLRHFLIDTLHFDITTETYVYDEGKYYSILDVNAGNSDPVIYTEVEYMFGKNIEPSSLDIYMDFLHFRHRVLNTAKESAQKGSSEKSLKKLSELKKEITLVETALLKEGGTL